MKKKIVFFTGAGISQESGLMTFRGLGGIWGQFDPDVVADISAWQCGKRRDCRERRQKALDFFNPLRRMILEHQPNEAHRLIASIEDEYDVTVITQNGDNYHTLAGSSNVIYLHGEALKNCSCANPYRGWVIDPANPDIHIGDKAPDGSQIRPYVIYFRENLDKRLWTKAVRAMKEADYVVVVGSSLCVYPAVDLLGKMKLSCELYIVDPGPHKMPRFCVHNFKASFTCTASEGVKKVIEHIKMMEDFHRQIEEYRSKETDCFVIDTGGTIDLTRNKPYIRLSLLPKDPGSLRQTMRSMLLKSTEDTRAKKQARFRDLLEEKLREKIRQDKLRDSSGITFVDTPGIVSLDNDEDEQE